MHGRLLFSGQAEISLTPALPPCPLSPCLCFCACVCLLWLCLWWICVQQMKMTFILLSSSLLLPVCLSLCMLVRAHPLTVPEMGPEPSQRKWQVEEIVFAGPFCCSVFHALVDLWLVHRRTYQGTSIDQVKHLNEALSSFFLCVSMDQSDHENHSGSLWDLITDIKWSYRVVKDCCWLSSCWQSSAKERVTSLSAWVPVGHALWFSVSCTVMHLCWKICSLIQCWNT